MAASPRSWKDTIWLLWFALQPFIILFVDAVSLYPPSLYQPPTSPLHFLARLRSFYITTYNDPIVQWSPETATPHSSWIHLFLLIELGFSLPVTLYGINVLGFNGYRTGKSTTGPQELLFFVYAFEVAFTTLVCVHDIGYWDGNVWDDDMKNVFRWQIYGPYLAVPTIMCIDMAARILARFRAADRISTTKKAQ